MKKLLLFQLTLAVLFFGCATTDNPQDILVQEQDYGQVAVQEPEPSVATYSTEESITQNNPAITNNGIIITDSEIRILNPETEKEEIVFFWESIIDYDNHTLRISFQENPEFDFSWMSKLVCAYVVPWTRTGETGYFVRNSTKGRGTNPGTDNFNVTFTHDFKDTNITGFSFTRLILEPRYDYKDETIITNPWSSNWTFTDQSVLYSNDEFHKIIGTNEEGIISGSNSLGDRDD